MPVVFLNNLGTTVEATFVLYNTFNTHIQGIYLGG